MFGEWLTCLLILLYYSEYAVDMSFYQMYFLDHLGLYDWFVFPSQDNITLIVDPLSMTDVFTEVLQDALSIYFLILHVHTPIDKQ